MARLVRQYDRSLTTEVSHIVFAAEDTLAFTTLSGDVWKVEAGLASAKPELLFSARQVLTPVAQHLGKAEVEPASGGYPRLAISLLANCVIVNTHDLILVTCPLGGEGQPRLLPGYWGCYYPRLEFSPDHSRFSAHSDYLLVFNTSTWDCHTLDVEDCCWYPQQQTQLCLEFGGELLCADRSKGTTPSICGLGTIGLRDGYNQARGLTVLKDGERFVVAFYPPRLELWQFKPLQLLESRETAEEEIMDCRLSPNGRWLLILTEHGVRLWDTETPFGLSDLFPGISELDFAPSGQRFITLESETGLVSCWEISE